MTYDVIIIGAGAAGMTSGIYTARKNLKTLIVSIGVGGQTAIPSKIENYPGFDEVNGFELMAKFQMQAMKWGAEMITGKVQSLDKKEDGTFLLKLANEEEYSAKAVILAFGKTPNNLGVPGEDKFMGKGVSVCVTCDGPLFRNKSIVIVGGGNSALGGVQEMAGIAKKIYLVHRRNEFRADEIEVKRTKALENVEFVLSSVPTEVKGDQFVQALSVKNLNTEEVRDLEVDGVFIEIGFKVDSNFLGELVKRNERNEIIIDNNNLTSQAGVFAAGDVTNVQFKQTVISAGEGAKAALSAYHYLSGAKGTVSVDWDK